MYSPTTTTRFSANFASFETLKVLNKCGLCPLFRQTRCTVALLHPITAAIERTDHCVESPGNSCVVRRMISASSRDRTVAGGPERDASFSIPPVGALQTGSATFPRSLACSPGREQCPCSLAPGRRQAQSSPARPAAPAYSAPATTSPAPPAPHPTIRPARPLACCHPLCPEDETPQRPNKTAQEGDASRASRKVAIGGTMAFSIMAGLFCSQRKKDVDWLLSSSRSSAG